MSEEEMQRKIEFIVNHQAQFTVDVQNLKELHAQAEKRTDRMERLLKLVIKAGFRARREMREHAADIKRNAEEMREVDARISTLVASQLETEALTHRNSEAIHRNSEAISELAGIVRQLAMKRNGDGADGR